MTSNISNRPWRPSATLEAHAKTNCGDMGFGETKLRSSSDDDEEEGEDMDALIEELESEDPEPAVVEEDFTSPKNYSTPTPEPASKNGMCSRGERSLV
jgi:hypothetical protein